MSSTIEVDILGMRSNSNYELRITNQEILFGLVILADIVTKWAVLSQFFFQTKIFENPGLPFGIILAPRVFNFAAVAVIFIVFVWLYFRYLASPQSRFAFTLIASGTVANLLDRLGDGKVTDFINLGISTANLADLAIMMGIAWLILNIKNKKAKIRNF